MPSLALRPRSPTELVDAAFQVLRAHYPQFVMCSAIAYLPWLITDIVRASDPASLAIPDLGRTLLLGLVMWLSFAVMNSVLIACAAQAYLGEPIHVASAVRKAVVRAPAVLVGATLRFILIGFAFLFLFLPALYPAARFFAVTPAILLEGKGPLEAFSRSSELSRGRKWHVLLTIGLVFVIYLVLLLGIFAVLQIVSNLLVQVIVTALFTILVYPVVAITETLLYYAPRIKHEGLDIELMAGALDSRDVERESAAS
jgi:hypothetical protein